MAGMYIYNIFAAVLSITVSANNECTYTKDTQIGCTVDRGHAVCESRDLYASVRGIPACTTWITLSLQKLDPNFHPDWILIFSVLQNLPQIEKLSITVNQEKYETILFMDVDQWITLRFPKLKILQTRSTQRAQTSLAEADHYSHIAHCKNVEPWL